MGLTGLSQAIHWNRMSGHPPAAVIAAYFFCQENGLAPDVQSAVQGLVDRVVSGSASIWHTVDGQPVTNAGLFRGQITGSPDEKLISRVASALEGSLAACRDSGHNTIFASLALKALHAAPEYALPPIIAGIVQLLEDFNGRGPGFAHVPGQDQLVDPRELPVPDDLHLPDYQSTDDMVAAVCAHVVPRYFNTRGVGGPIHVIDHAAALLDLEASGYSSLVRQGLAAHHQHLTLWLSLPPFPAAENPYRVPTQSDPRAMDYWNAGITLRDQGGYEHRLKFLYGAYRFAAHIQDEGERRVFLATAAHLY
jgi:hypothetical protein